MPGTMKCGGQVHQVQRNSVGYTIDHLDGPFVDTREQIIEDRMDARDTSTLKQLQETRNAREGKATDPEQG